MYPSASRASQLTSPAPYRPHRTMEERTSQLLEQLRKRTDSKKSPHPKKLLGPKYSGIIRAVQDREPQGSQGYFEYMLDYEESIKRKANEERKLEITNERLANLFRKTIKEQMDLSAHRLKEQNQKTPHLVAQLQRKVVDFGDLVEITKELEDDVYNLRDQVIENHSHLCEHGVELFKLKQQSKNQYTDQKLESAKLKHNPRLDLLAMKTVLGLQNAEIEENQKVTYYFNNEGSVTVSKAITPYERQKLWDKAVEVPRTAQKRKNPDQCVFSVANLKKAK